MTRILLVCMGIVVAVASTAFAAPTAVPYVGFLTYESGGAVDGDIDLIVEVWSASSGGSSLWGPASFDDVPVHDGVFSVLLGGASSPDLAPALDSGGELWIAFTVDAEPLTPRQAIYAVPYARRAESAANATSLGGVQASNFAQTGDLPNAALSGSFNDLVDVPPDLAQAAGTAGTVPVFSGSSSLVDSVITQSGSSVGINAANPATTLDVGGELRIREQASLGTCSGTNEGALKYVRESDVGVFYGCATTDGTDFEWQRLNGGDASSSGTLQGLGTTASPWVHPGGALLNCHDYRTHADYANEGTGIYTVDPDGAVGAAAFSVYCDMTTDEGGWTYIANIAGNSQAHANNVGAVNATTLLQNPASNGSAAKFSDASMEAIRVTSTDRIIRMVCGSSITYWDASTGVLTTADNGDSTAYTSGWISYSTAKADGPYSWNVSGHFQHRLLSQFSQSGWIAYGFDDARLGCGSGGGDSGFVYIR